MNIFKKKVELKIVEQENGAVVFDKTHGIYFQTNNVGVNIIKSLSEGKTINETIDNIAEIFNVDKTQAASDVNEYIDSLKKAGIV